jgi:hypothetical protein
MPHVDFVRNNVPLKKGLIRYVSFSIIRLSPCDMKNWNVLFGEIFHLSIVSYWQRSLLKDLMKFSVEISN